MKDISGLREFFLYAFERAKYVKREKKSLCNSDLPAFQQTVSRWNGFPESRSKIAGRFFLFSSESRMDIGSLRGEKEQF